MEDEDEANADLTMGILAKAHSRPPTELSFSPKTRAFFADEEDEQHREEHVIGSSSDELGSKRRSPIEDANVVSSNKRSKTLTIRGKGTTMSDPIVIENPVENTLEKRVKKKKKKKKSKKQKVNGQQEDIVVDEPELKELSSQEESLTVRKLLRAPRYFDTPEDLEASVKTCYNCGEPGHLAADCTTRKPCYVCGDLSHEGKNCTQNAECYVCGKTGHRAKACPEKGKQGGLRVPERVCLHCGDPGHETNACRKNYDPDDMKAMQCYVCKQFGHLCCLDGLDGFPREVSCYKCGGTGHTGVGCAKSRSVSSATKAKPPATCFKCGLEGHYARGCSQASSERPTESTCYKCGAEGHYARDCSQASSERPTESTCYKCGAEGHYARDCSQADKPFEKPQQCYRCGREGHYARDCNQARWPGPWPPEDADADFPRGTKLPRWMEMQMRNGHDDDMSLQNRYQRRLDNNSNSKRRQQRPLADLLHESSNIRIPRWYEVENR